MSNPQPWREHYPEFVPYEINPDSYGSIPEMVQYTIEKYPKHVAFENMGVGINFKKFGELIDAFASYIQNHTDLKPGDKISHTDAQLSSVSYCNILEL